LPATGVNSLTTKRILYGHSIEFLAVLQILAAKEFTISVHGYFVSAQEYAELQRLHALERRAYRLSELPAEVADAIEASKMNPAHDHLNDLLKERK
jgi:hypothetical protein